MQIKTANTSFKQFYQHFVDRGVNQGISQHSHLTVGQLTIVCCEEPLSRLNSNG